MFTNNRRKKIASAVVEEIGKHLDNPLLSNPDFIRGIFDGVLLRDGFDPPRGEKEARRIYKDIERRIAERVQATDGATVAP